MRTKCLYLLIASIVILSTVVADDGSQGKEKSNAKSWLKGLLSSIFGSESKMTSSSSKNATTSNRNESTISGNDTEHEKGPTNKDANVTSTVGQTTKTATAVPTTTTTMTTSTKNLTASSNQTTLTNTTKTAAAATTHASLSSGKTTRSGINHSTPSLANTTKTNAVTTTRTSSSTNYKTKTTGRLGEPKGRKKNCLTDIPLDNFCILPSAFVKYLNGNSSVDMVYSKTFSESLITRLREQCAAGEWCLPEDQLSHFASQKDAFYKSPLCDDGFVECLSVIAQQYSNCPIRHKVAFLAHTLGLLCGMKILQPNITEKCFGETMANLHLTRATILQMKNNQENSPNNAINDYCSAPAGKMTKNYLCNIERCPKLRIMLITFYPWQWFLRAKPSPADYCNYVQPCGVDTDTTTPAPGKAPHNDEHSFFYVVTGDDSTSLVVGIATGTVMALVGLTILVCAVHKRTRRANGALYRSGYSMLPHNDE